MKIKNIYILLFALAMGMFGVSCQDEIGDHDVKGEAMLSFTVSSPKSGETVTVNNGQPNKTVKFEWNKTESGLGSQVTYKVLFDKVGGDFSSALLSVNAENEGKDNNALIKYSQLKEIVDAVKKDGDEFVTVGWTVEASNGSANKVMAESFVLKMPVSSEGLSTVNLGAPGNNYVFDVNGDSQFITLSWSESSSTNASSSVKYKVLVDKVNGDFSNPILELDSDNSGQDTLIKKTPSDWKDAFAGKLSNDSYKWTVRAYTDNFSIMAEEAFNFYLPTLPSIYIVGGAVADISGDNGWLIDQAIELKGIAKNVWAGVVNLRSDRQGGEFKFFPVKGDWGNGIGKDAFEQFIGKTSANDNGNINFTGDNGEYAIYLDLNTKKLTVINKLYLVGGSTSADANPANSIGSMMFDGKFHIFSYITQASWGYKFLPTQEGDWRGDFGKIDGKDGLFIQEGEANMSVPEDGFYQLIIDFNEGKYSALKTEWAIIGHATAGGWGSDQDMTFVPLAGGEKKGAYKWTITTDLVVGEFKFRANDDWNPPTAANFGDNGTDGSLEPGGANIPINEAGNYTIDLILAPTGYTYTITKN